jgi:hypothetical protein
MLHGSRSFNARLQSSIVGDILRLLRGVVHPAFVEMARRLNTFQAISFDQVISLQPAAYIILTHHVTLTLPMTCTRVEKHLTF